jgi:hypothetical protein
MKKQFYIPYLTAIVAFFLIALIYCSPAIQGKAISMTDINNYKGQAKEIQDYKKKTGEDALWSNSAFGGMPTFLLSTPAPTKTLSFFNRIFNLNHFRPVSFIFLYMLGFYICLLGFGVKPWLSIIGAVAYGFSSFFFIIIPAGHISKVIALGYMPIIIGGFYLAFQGKKLIGGITFGIALALQILVNHLQITYYTMIIILVMGVNIFIVQIKNNEIKTFLQSTGIIALMTLLAVGSNFRTLWTIYEYSQYSTRGKSELVVNEEDQTSGLDISYATDWSYGPMESFTLLIPNFMGGPTYSEIPENSESYDFLIKRQSKKQAKTSLKQMPTYWGEQRFTAGPVYVGAIICFLFIMGLFLVDNRYKWWILAGTIISLILSWGKHIPGFTAFLFNHLPGYNKFRAVSNALVIAEFTMPLLAILSIDKIIKGDLKKETVLKGLKYATIIAGGVIIFFILFAGSLFSFNAIIDERYLSQGATDFVDVLREDRLMILRKDAWRSLIFILFAAGATWLFIKGKTKEWQFLLVLGSLILVDMWGVNLRYFNSEHFENKRKASIPFIASKADEIINQDSDPSYRVLNLTVDPFNDASTSYFHQSIGGYHGAKMKRYQELIEHRIQPELQSLIKNLQSATQQGFMTAFDNTSVLNMLNTKYLIINRESTPLLNRKALGNAWFIDTIKWVSSANEEMDALKDLNTSKEAVIDTRFRKNLENFSPKKTDSLANIRLIEYKPDELTYKSNSLYNQLAVFSEIFYPKGWKVTIDGESVEYFRANYLLRAMVVPKGKHTIVFKFKPQSYYLGQKVSMASSIILLLLLLGSIAFHFKSDILKNIARKNT